MAKHRHKVLVDNFADGEKGKTVDLEEGDLTDALVEAGVVEPASKAAKDS